MNYRPFGRTGLEVSVIGFGAAAISGEGRGYGFGAIGDRESVELVHHCLDQGINLLDTAPIYGMGLSEERLGMALADRRTDAIIVSKSGIDWDDRRRINRTNDPAIAVRMLNESLARLKTDYIDVFLVHWPDGDVDIRDTVAALAREQEAGKIRYLGLSNSFPEDIEKASEVADIQVLQNELNLFARYPIDALFPVIAKQGQAFMSWGTLDKGILTGRVTKERTYDKSDLRSRVPWWTKADRAPKYAAMSRITPLIEAAGHSGLELALGYVLGHAEVSSALCGVRSRDQLATAVAALAHLPPADLLEEALVIASNEVG